MSPAQEVCVDASVAMQVVVTDAFPEPRCAPEIGVEVI